MSSPDGSNNHRFTFNAPRQSPSAVIRLNRNAFVTMPTQHSQSSSTRPILIRPYYVPISQHQIVIPSVIPVTSVIRPQRPVHFKVTSAGKVITPRSSATPLNQTRPLAMARRPLTRPSGKALCSNCGVQSSDLETCESCWKNIKRQGPTSNKSTVENQVAKNIEDGLRATREEIERKSRKGIPSSSFYNGKAGESDFARYVRKAAVNPTPPRPQLKRPLLRRNTATASESVCITISSDSEGEDAANSSTVTVQAADSSTVSNDQSFRKTKINRHKLTLDQQPNAKLF